MLLSPVKRSSGLKSAPIKQRLQAKTVQNKDSMLVVSDVRRQQVDEEIPPDECLEKSRKSLYKCNELLLFSLEKVLLWIMHLYFGQ